MSESDLIKEIQRPQILPEPQKNISRKRKRGQAAGCSSPLPQNGILFKGPRRSIPSGTAKVGLQAKSDTSKNHADPIETWTRTKWWPSQYSDQDSQAREDCKRDNWLEEQMEESSQMVQYLEINGRKYPRPVRKVPTSLYPKEADSSLSGSSDEKKRESKCAQYRDIRYTTLLAAKGSYMREFNDDGVPKNIRTICQTLLESAQSVPQNSLFRDDLFQRTCRELEDRNKAMVIQDVARLIVPSAKTLSVYGARHLDHLMENVNEGWAGSIPVQGPRPQPDYSVGFRRSAFTEEQLSRLDPLIGTVYDTSFFVATYRMYFPFLTCEVKCGASALDIADRQNAHSMTLAVRGVVELYRAVKREKELDQEILAFSISHNHRAVRIYGHYPVINGDKTTFYRHPIHEFSFTALEGKDKWTAYKFTKNIYDVWMPTHLKRICSAIDQLPHLDFEVSKASELQFAETSELSQESGSLFSEHFDVESDFRTSRNGSEQVPIVLQMNTPDTSVSNEQERAAAKKPKRKHGAN